MIFVTVGAQMPFDRLVSAVDAWAAHARRDSVFAQIGPSRLKPRNIGWARFLAPAEFRERVRKADAIVAHAGMGTILTALEFGKPVIVMPRRGDLQETRNDHQVATAERFRRLGGVHVASDDAQLAECLDGISTLTRSEPIRPWASTSLLDALRKFVRNSVPAEHGKGRRFA